MPFYQLVAMDLDGTLLTSDTKITPRTRKALQDCADSGVKVVFASGRMLGSIAKVADQASYLSGVIAYNGALIAEWPSRSIVRETPIPGILARRLVTDLKKSGVHINVYLNDTLYIEELNEAARNYCRNTAVEPSIANFDELLNRRAANPTKILIIGKPEELDVMAEEYRAGYPELHVTKSRPHFLEFTVSGINKGTALKELAELLGIARERVVAIGDAPNDLDMIKYAGMGVAVGNSFEQVKAEADLIAPSNDEEGVAWVIERYIQRG
ncbi:MAG: Cof-type HAD-IIB family hydrolase [Bacillota bacterium]|jgi:Cof subfamily protein (haloacid dehalogenase superfamily)